MGDKGIGSLIINLLLRRKTSPPLTTYREPANLILEVRPELEEDGPYIEVESKHTIEVESKHNLIILTKTNDR